jgi:hypothetical protein
MRRTLGFVLLAVLGASFLGCFSTGNQEQAETTAAGVPGGDKERTQAYWGQLRPILLQKSTSSDLRVLTKVVQTQVNAIRELPRDGVEPELLAEIDALLRYQDKVIEAAEVADFQFASLRSSPDLRKQFSDASQQAIAATARVKALRGKLAARYRAEFPSLEN